MKTPELSLQTPETEEDKVRVQDFIKLTQEVENYHTAIAGKDGALDREVENLLITMHQIAIQLEPGQIKPAWIPETIKNLSVRAKNYLKKR